MKTASPQASPAVVFRDVTKVYNGRVTALDHVSFGIPRGATVALLGPNGAGKSTAIDTMLGLRKPTSGDVRVLGMSPAAAVAAGKIGGMVQTGGLPDGAKVSELIALFRQLYRSRRSQADLLRLAGLTGIADRRVEQLSGGQIQRVRFALSLAGRPDLLFLDEPTAALDVEARRAFWQSVQAIADQGTTVLFATHYLDEADANASRIIVVSHGRIMADGTPSQIKAYTTVRTIRFSTPVPDTSALLRLPAVNDVVASGHAVTIRSGDADATLPALYALGQPVRGLEVGGGGLEEALIALTGDGDTAAVPVTNSFDMTRVG
ncbi:MAG TPA: ABC transporter ATP-binding protein [Streptosporangiaceae bacterium]|nr:ABC transporter ATP-binding protein [Streptosporangiaceae bacterium]